MHKVVLSAIEEQCIKLPMSIAICDGDQTFSYQDLEISANRLAHYLQRHGVTTNDIVALYMRRSFDVLVAMLAVWKLGAAYLSLDVDAPFKRLKNIIHQAQPKCIITEPALLDVLPSEILQLTCQDPEYSNFDNTYINGPEINDQQMAYIIYTSGSTGQPKGVLVTHANLANYLFWFNQRFHITQQDIFSFNSSSAFDFAVTCTHAPLMAGAQVLITSEIDVLDIERYCNQLVKHRVTFAKWTPSYFKVLVNYIEKHKPDLAHLRYIMIAGEELLTTYVERWFVVYPLHTIINEYGPTETTVGITTQVITKRNLNRELKTVPIGQPIKNTNLYVVDTEHHLLPLGAVGELWVGGASVACGYYKAPELTQIRFIENPFSKEKNILYKTGDLVKQLADNVYLYVGRMDNQVKINGYRVEISEIEHCLLQKSEIDHVCIIVKEDNDNSQYLVAYIILKSPNMVLNKEELRQYIAQHLPQFMIPRYYYVVDNIPLTSNGKVDYRALVAQTGKLGVV